MTTKAPPGTPAGLCIHLFTSSPIMTPPSSPDAAGNTALDAATNILSNGNFVGTTGWTGIYGSLSATANVLSVTGAGSVTYFGARQTTTVTYTAGHKVYQRARFRVTDANCVTVRFSYAGSVSGGATTTVQSAPAINTWYEKSIVHTLNAGSGSVLETFYAYYASAGATSGKVMDLQYVISIDLTAAFGAGSEPTAAQMDTLLAHFTNKWFDGTVYDGTLFNERIGEVGREVVHAATTAAARTALGVEIAVGKNLLDVSTVTAGYYVADSYGGLQASTNYSASAFIPISASTVYTLSHKQYLCECWGWLVWD